MPLPCWRDALRYRQDVRSEQGGSCEMAAPWWGALCFLGFPRLGSIPAPLGSVGIQHFHREREAGKAEGPTWQQLFVSPQLFPPARLRLLPCERFSQTGWLCFKKSPSAFKTVSTIIIHDATGFQARLLFFQWAAEVPLDNYLGCAVAGLVRPSQLPQVALCRGCGAAVSATGTVLLCCRALPAPGCSRGCPGRCQPRSRVQDGSCTARSPPPARAAATSPAGFAFYSGPPLVSQPWYERDCVWMLVWEGTAQPGCWVALSCGRTSCH